MYSNFSLAWTTVKIPYIGNFPYVKIFVMGIFDSGNIRKGQPFSEIYLRPIIYVNEKYWCNNG